MLNLLKRLRKSKPIMQSVPGGEWLARDTINMQGFLNSRTGIKWLGGIRHTLYLEVMDPKRKDEWEDGRRAGIAHVIHAIDDILGVSAISLLEVAREEEAE